MTQSICPKCRYQRQAIDHNIHPDICPSCGIVYSEFMMFLGGSLFQVLLPLALMCVLVLKQRDTFGGGEESHDWGNLLTMMDALDNTQTIANCSFGVGTVLIIVALVWGGWILKLQLKNVGSIYD